MASQGCWLEFKKENDEKYFVRKAIFLEPFELIYSKGKKKNVIIWNDRETNVLISFSFKKKKKPNALSWIEEENDSCKVNK